MQRCLPTLSAMFIITGCFSAEGFLVDQPQFQALSGVTFPATEFKRCGSGLTAIGDGMEYTEEFKPLEPAKINLDLSGFTRHLQAQESFDCSSGGGSPTSYYRSALSNSTRFVSIDAYVLKDGTVRLVYRELLR